MSMLTDRLKRSKRMLKARKKLNYEGKNREHEYLDYPYSHGNQRQAWMKRYVVMYINLS
jgi:hypothetical protein